MTTFKDLGLSDALVQAIDSMGFDTPTAIQEKTIPFLLDSSEDLIALAQTGTGKTAGFGLPILQQLTNASETQVLILCPTRELCLQITKDFHEYTKYMDRSEVVAVYGGTSIGPQIKALKKNPSVVVGTPGRALDLLNRGQLNIGSIRWLVLDEADEMLSMGFKEELDQILSKTPDGKQTLLFSATMPKGIVSIAGNYMHKPQEISVGAKNQGAENVSHIYHMVQNKHRYPALKRIFNHYENLYGIVFCRTRKDTREVADKLVEEGYQAEALSGDLSQYQRDQVMKRFRNRQVKMLVATDVAARGLDVDDLTHVIHFHLPDDPEVYIHRSGRTGRAGKEGISVSFVGPNEQGSLRTIEQTVGKKIQYEKVPSGEEVVKKQMEQFIEKLRDTQIQNEEVEKLLPEMTEKLEDLDKATLIEKLLAINFNQLPESDAMDLNAKQRAKRESVSAEGKGVAKNKGYTRLFMNMGREHQLGKKELINLINQQLPDEKVDIGDIQILDNCSFFEVDNQFDKVVQRAMKKAEYKGNRIHVAPAKPPKKNNSRVYN